MFRIEVLISGIQNNNSEPEISRFKSNDLQKFK
jgi:hypothetical protein